MEQGQKDLVATQIAARDGRTIFFVRTKHGADKLAEKMLRAGVPVGVLHGGKSQGQRTRVLAAFKDGRATALVATDVAARGIHVDDVSLVVHYDAPADHKDYLHRAGRTARAGATGVVVTLATHKQKKGVYGITNQAKVKLSEVYVKPSDPELVKITGSKEPSGIPVIVEAEKPSRNDRGSRDRGDRGGFRRGHVGSFKKRSEGGGRRTEEDRPERSDRPTRSEKPVRSFRGATPTKPKYEDRPARAERPVRTERPERSERVERSERPAKSDRFGKPSKFKKSFKSNRPDIGTWKSEAETTGEKKSDFKKSAPAKVRDKNKGAPKKFAKKYEPKKFEKAEPTRPGKKAAKKSAPRPAKKSAKRDSAGNKARAKRA